MALPSDTAQGIGSFKLPNNIQISIYQTLVNLITNDKIIPVSKDFLVVLILKVLDKLVKSNADLVR